MFIVPKKKKKKDGTTFMDNTTLFTAALQLESPWQVTNVEFLPDEDNEKKMTLHMKCYTNVVTVVANKI